MFNISGYGLTITMLASNTFPVGVLLTNWPDDQDPLSFPEVDIADGEVGVNGDLIVWSKGAKIPCTISCIPDSPTDLQLAVLFQANRVGKNKIGARDIIQMGVIQGNNNFGTFTNGIIVSGPPFNGVQSSGRMKTKSYGFIFESPYAI